MQKRCKISPSHNHMLSFVCRALFSPTSCFLLIQSHNERTLCLSSSVCFPLCLVFVCHSFSFTHSHTVSAYTHMYISLWSDASTPLHLSLQTGSYKTNPFAQLQSERGVSGGTNWEGNQRDFPGSYIHTVTVKQWSSRQRSQGPSGVAVNLIHR